MARYESKWWSAQPPEGWTVEEDPVSTSFYRPGGVGVLQVSAVRKSSGDVSDAELERFVTEQYGSRSDFDETQVGELKGLERSWEEEDAVWRTWFLRCGPLVFCVTYNCGLEEAGAESEEVEAILESISPEV